MAVQQDVGQMAHANALPAMTMPLLKAHLAGVALTSPDPARLSRFYTDAMGYEGQTSAGLWISWLQERWLTISKGAANSVDFFAFAVSDQSDFAALLERLAATSVPYEKVPPSALLGASIDIKDPDGNRLRIGVASKDQRVGDPCPGGARLQHIVFASDEAPAMVRFYCDILGFAPSDYVHDDSGDLTSAFLRCSSEHHSIAIFRAPRKRLDHLCYDVDDWIHIRNWADRFADQHMVLKWGPGRHGPGNNLFFFVNDPDGNWLEFSAELELVEGARVIKQWPHEERTLNSWGTAFLRS